MLMQGAEGSERRDLPHHAKIANPIVDIAVRRDLKLVEARECTTLSVDRIYTGGRFIAG